MTTIFPWQTDVWQTLTTRVKQHNLPHALLLTGIKGIGKTEFARAFAEWLVCQATLDEKPCGKCRSCQLVNTPAHPDLTEIHPEGASLTIKIDQIRHLTAYIANTAHFHGYRVITLHEAHRLQPAASHALLKTLEEPPQQVLFMLLTDKKHQITPTIASRCQTLKFPTPNVDQVTAWISTQTINNSTPYPIDLLMHLAQGSPLETLALMQNDSLGWREHIINDVAGVMLGQLNPLGFSEKYKSLALSQFLFWLSTMIADIIQLKVQATQRVMHADHMPLLKQLAKQSHTAALYAYLDSIYRIIEQVGRGANLNHALTIDGVFSGLTNP